MYIIVCSFSSCHCIVCPLIHSFWLPPWYHYLQTFLMHVFVFKDRKQIITYLYNTHEIWCHNLLYILNSSDIFQGSIVRMSYTKITLTPCYVYIQKQAMQKRKKTNTLEQKSIKIQIQIISLSWRCIFPTVFVTGCLPYINLFSVYTDLPISVNQKISALLQYQGKWNLQISLMDRIKNSPLQVILKNKDCIVQIKDLLHRQFYLLLCDDFRIGQVISPRVAVLAWGEVEGQYSCPRTNN